MKVAVIGAGLSGLACAYVLKANGIKPTIFERKGYVGEALDLPAIDLKIFNVSRQDPVKYLRDKYNIYIAPSYELREIITHSPSNTFTVDGHMGYIFLRGREPGYLSMQMEGMVNLDYKLNSLVYPEYIRKDFDHIAVCNGTLEVPLKMNLAEVNFSAYVRIASILGKFNINSVSVWMNSSYAKHGYAYLVPVNEESARFVLIVDGIEKDELDFYWNEFIRIEKLTYPIIEMKDILHEVGTLSRLHVDNMYFAGNAGGFIDSMLGFGSMKAILSGAAAAECIIKGLDYDKHIKWLTKDIKRKHELRKLFNTFTNDDMDRFCSIENAPFIRRLVFNTPLLRVTQGSSIIKAFNFVKGNK